MAVARLTEGERLDPARPKALALPIAGLVGWRPHLADDPLEDPSCP
jgi:hypothetical protein